MADPNDRRTDGAPPKQIHIEKKPINWLAWLLLLAGIIALLFALNRCSQRNIAVVAPVATESAAPSGVVAETSGAPASTALTSTSGLGTYLAGTGPTPQTFTFDKVLFDTAKSDIRPDNRGDVAAVASALKSYPGAHVRIAGYADSRGSEPANVKLGQDRANAVKAALVADGIDAGRIEAVSGGEKDPVDTNATAGGRAENRRTELVVTQRK